MKENYCILFLFLSLISHFSLSFSNSTLLSVLFVTIVLFHYGPCSPVINSNGFHTCQKKKKIDHWLLKGGKVQPSLLMIRYYKH